MSELHKSKNPALNDWHRADIVAALHKKGWSIRQLSIAAGLNAGTLKTALDKPWPKGEQIIAEAIGIKPEQIWPVRYALRNFTPVLTLSPSLIRREKSTDKIVTE